MKMMIVLLLGAASLGGLFFALVYPKLSGGSPGDRLQKLGKGGGGQARETAKSNERDAVRRKQISENLKGLENGGKKKLTLEARIGQAGLEWNRSQFFLFSGGCALAVGLLLLFMSHAPLVALMGLVIGGLGVPNWFLGLRKKKRLANFAEAFPAAIDVIIRGIKAGLPLTECIRIIGNEAPEPLGAEFRGIIEAQQMGLTLGEAVSRIAERIPTAESNFFSIVINIQQKAGGNLSEALGNLSRVLRDRKKMKMKIKAMSTEATASASIIGSLPIIVATLVYVTSPAYISMLWTTETGPIVLLGCAIWMAVGISIMRKMINFDV